MMCFKNVFNNQKVMIYESKRIIIIETDYNSMYSFVVDESNMIHYFKNIASHQNDWSFRIFHSYSIFDLKLLISALLSINCYIQR